MDTSPLWPILLTVLVLIVIAALLFLYLRAERNLRQDTETQRSALAKVMEIELARSSSFSQRQDSLLQASRAQAAEMLAATREEMARSQSLAQKAMDLTMTRALGGFEAAQRKQSELIASMTAIIATRDPLAYRQVYDAPAPDTGTGMYPAADEGEQDLVAAREQEQVGLDAARLLLESIGASGGGTGLGPYSGPAD